MVIKILGMTKIVELRPDRNLLKSNFDGYKLSLEPIPILKHELISGSQPDRIFKSQAQFSFLDAQIFSLHNHLFRDDWLDNTYFIDGNMNIQKISYDEKVGKLKPLNAVGRIALTDRQPGDYNLDLRFVCEKFALVTDGTGNLFIFDTGDRLKNNEWKQIATLKPLESRTGFVIKDCKLQIVEGVKVISCLLLHIEHSEEPSFSSTINWIDIKQNFEENTWTIVSRKTVQGKGSLYYSSFDPKCKAIIISSDKPFKFTYDSINPVVVEESSAEKAMEEQIEPSVDNFDWFQTDEDLLITLKEFPGAEMSDYTIKCLSKHLEISYRDEVLINSDLFEEIDTDMTTWSLDKNILQLILVKQNPNLVWPFFIPGGPNENAARPNRFSAPLSNLTSQIEECDFGLNGSDNEFFIERIDATNHKSTHKVFLGQYAPLFDTNLRPGFPRAVAIQNDVDCCLWLQNLSPDQAEWSFKHEGTLHAFAYIQASKQQKKFMQCSPDLNYGVICESERHLFIYKNSYSTASGLRKRQGPQLSIGQQNLVTFESSLGEVLGIAAFQEIVILLTEHFLVCLQLSIEE